MRTKGSKGCRNRRNGAMRKDVRSVGNRVAEVGLEYFCPDYVSKNGVSVMEHNTLCGNMDLGLQPFLHYTQIATYFLCKSMDNLLYTMDKRKCAVG